jgi:hypothetical protein
LSRLVRGELDWIVMKALEKDWGRRYETANAFATDVQRYLADEPVLACPPSMGYRFRKFARRNKGPFIVAVALLTALILGIAGTTAGLLRARAERDRVLTTQERLRQALADLTEAKQRMTEARIDAMLPDEPLSDEQIKYLKSQVQRFEELWRYTNTLAMAGRRGGESFVEAESLSKVHSAKARVAWAEGDLAQCLREYEAAIAATDERIAGLQALYETDRSQYPALADAENDRTELRLCASKVKRRIPVRDM